MFELLIILFKEPEAPDVAPEQERLLANLISLLDTELKTGEPVYIADYYRIIITYLKFKKNAATGRHTGALTLIEKGVIQKLLEVALGTLSEIFLICLYIVLP